MAIVNEGLNKELEWVTKPEEKLRIRGILENARGILQDMAYGVIVGNQHEVDRLTKEALDSGMNAETILDDGLIGGMSVVGVKFRDNIIFVPEVLVAARAMKAGMTHLEPILSASEIEPLGTVIMGTVKGDLHDIGKNLCTMMLRGAGFEVHDLGVDTKAEEFIEAVREHDADVVGMSALLTTTMENIGRNHKAFEEAGLRGRIKLMAGGAALSVEMAKEMKADGYGRDAVACVEKAKELLGIEEKLPASVVEE